MEQNEKINPSKEFSAKAAIPSMAEYQKLYALADKDPQGALNFLQTLPAGRLRQNLYWPIFSKWTASDPIAAAERASQLPPGQSRDGTAMAMAIQSRRATALT